MITSWNELLQKAQKMLEVNQVPDARTDAWYLMEDTFQISRTTFLMERMRKNEKSDELIAQYEALISKRAKRIPLQYILHNQEFMGLDFYVDESVLIPRQDTEVLVEQILNDFPGKNSLHIMDMCTGSGCIAISLDKLGKFEMVFGADISKEALLVAEKNRKALGSSVHFYQSDLFSQIPKEQQYDILVSNPPYIRKEERKNLMPEVAEYEPSIALFAEEDGTRFYRLLAEEGRMRLREGGSIYFEIGCEQAEVVSKILKQSGYRQIVVKQDLAGLDRVVKAKK